MTLFNEEKLSRAKAILEPLKIPLEDYQQICNAMNHAMSNGLKKENKNSSIKMFPTYVSKIPNGTESGKYLALDLGGTNYRVLAIVLNGKGEEAVIKEKSYSVPSHIMTGTAQELFTYIVEAMVDFLKSYDIINETFDLGFTFSFPCKQHGLNSASLLKWTKGFFVSGVEGENVAQLLQDAINKTGIKVKCVAVVNDTVGTMAACALRDPKCAIGLIVGTGTNAAYIESRDRVETVEGECGPEVVINTEWGAFGENRELDTWRTSYDISVDTESINPGKQLFEKMISGMYLGELMRHILLHLAKEGILFDGIIPDSIQRKNTVLTKFLTDIERDPPDIYYNTHYMLTRDLNVPVVDTTDGVITRYICELVSKRAAYLTGVGIACILHRMARPDVTVGVDGSLFKFHPKFSQRMTRIIDKLKPPYTTFCLRLSEDGSGIGAAAIAAATAN